MEKLPNIKNSKDVGEQSISERLRARIGSGTKERLASQGEIMHYISDSMDQSLMTETHLAYALLQKGYGHRFVQEYLTNGSYAFFDKNGEPIDDIDKIYEIIKNFNYEVDKEKTLVPEE
ncbi:MAG: hypothetical protein QG580_135 [Patescibacteria group bacterium]|jgi:hypothetical protein|nr:hypothetical protein [Patescibacteria group bacterium]